jgi:ketosteroid isomerase-like protein
MRIGSISLLGIPLLVMGACAQPPKVDVEAERASLLAADKAWSQLGSDMDKLTSMLADDAVFLGEGMPKIIGRAAIRQAWTDMSKLPGFSIGWVPEGAVVAQSGDLGYTFGSNEIGVNDAKGIRVTTKGKYVTIWRKQPDGSWKVVVDTGNSDAPPAPSAAAKP